MANFSLDPNMGFPNPTPGIDPGPDYADNIQSSLTIIGNHNHAPGNGVQINPSGININSDLPMNSNNLTMVKTVNFTAQTAPLAGTAPNLGALYVSGKELYYNDEVGNVVPITLNGSVNAGAGSISGLPSGTASASFSASTFIFQSATNTPANLDGGSVIFRNITASSKGVTVNAPTALGSNYSLTWPLIPGSTGFVTLDTSGNFAASISTSQGIVGSNIANATIARTNLIAVGQQISSSCGDFNTVSSSFVDVTNLSVTITTSGRPVMILVQSDQSLNSQVIKLDKTVPSSTAVATISMVRDSTTISQYIMNSPNFATASITLPCPSMALVDPVASGTYTYKIQASTSSSSGSGNFTISRIILAAYEL